jgi:hypothetical protein
MRKKKKRSKRAKRKKSKKMIRERPKKEKVAREKKEIALSFEIYMYKVEYYKLIKVLMLLIRFVNEIKQSLLELGNHFL